MTKHLEIILKKMCKMVGANFDKIDFKEQNWFQKYSWTEKQQEEFKQWFITYLKSDKEAREELMCFPSKSKRELDKVWDEFNLNWGWRVE